MKTKLVSISFVAPGEYDVILDVDGETIVMRCRIAEIKGIRIVQPRPDLLSRLAFDPRILAAAVLAFDAAREAGTAQAEQAGLNLSERQMKPKDER